MTSSSYTRLVIAIAGATALAALAGCCKNNPPPATPATSAAVREVQQVPGAHAESVRPTNKEACDACKGVWQKHGLADEPSCVCRTKDSGKVCRDGADCEGQCIADADGFEVKQPGPPPKGHWRGKCSELDTTFGCNKIIAHGASKKPPEIADDAIDTICID